jgi:hypothetical protein
MGQRDDNPIPPHAMQCWLGDHDIFVALPMTTGGTPYIMRFPLNEGGLASALGLLHKRKAEVLDPLDAKALFNTRPGDPTANQPQVKLSKAQEKLRSETTEAQRANARALLAKMGIK